jgi:hypothetical protein
MWQLWASETLQKRLSNASVTLQKRSASGRHLLQDVLIYHGRFHGQWTRCCGALLARVQMCFSTHVCVLNLTLGVTPQVRVWSHKNSVYIAILSSNSVYRFPKGEGPEASKAPRASQKNLDPRARGAVKLCFSARNRNRKYKI